MQVAAQDFCVVFIRKKIIKTCSWIDPNQRNAGYNYINITSLITFLKQATLILPSKGIESCMKFGTDTGEYGK